MRISDWSSDVCSSDLLEAIFAFEVMCGAKFAGRHLLHVSDCILEVEFVGRQYRQIDGNDEADVDLVDRRGLRMDDMRSEEHTSELQSLMRISYAVFCSKKKKSQTDYTYDYNT